MSSSRLAFGQRSLEGYVAQEETTSLASSHKRRIAARSCSPEEKSNQMGQKRQKSGRAKGRPENSGLSFACMFYKWDPVAYGGENGCSAWCNENIETVVRHHILDKHRKANKLRITRNEPHCLDDKRFDEVAEFKRQRIPGKSKEKYAEETWKAVYALLFGKAEEAKDEVPDPYFVSTTRPNDSGYNIDDIQQIIQCRISKEPSLGLEFQHLFQQIAKWERERQREKEKFRLEADRQKGDLKVQISQLEVQIRVIEEQQARQAQEIDDDYDERVSNNQSQLKAIMTGEPEVQARFSPEPLAPMLPYLETSFESEPPIPMHASPFQPPGFVRGYTDTQSAFGEPVTEDMLQANDIEDLLQANDTATSLTGTSAQLGSSNPSFGVNKCGICPTKSSTESLWCEECRSLTYFDEMP